MIIRAAKIQDVNRISYLIRKSAEHVEENLFSPIQKRTWSAQNKPKAIKESLKTRKIFCAFEHSKLIGTIALQGNLVCGMYVSYTKRGRGIGQQLMDHLLKYAKEIGIRELVLTATVSGYGFYLKNGFKEYGKMIHDFDGVKFPEAKMKKILK